MFSATFFDLLTCLYRQINCTNVKTQFAEYRITSIYKFIPPHYWLPQYLFKNYNSPRLHFPEVFQVFSVYINQFIEKTGFALRSLNTVLQSENKYQNSHIRNVIMHLHIRSIYTSFQQINCQGRGDMVGMSHSNL